MVTEAEIEAGAAAIFCHRQFGGDAYTAKQLARSVLEAAERARRRPASDQG